MPRLGVWMFGSIGRDALRACPAMAQPNGHVWVTSGPATGSPSAGPKLAHHVSILGCCRRSQTVGLFYGGRNIRPGPTMNLLRSQSISGLCDRHGSAILLALDGHVRNHVLAERFGAPPNGPVWISVPFRCRWSSKTKRSRGPHTRPIRRLKYVRTGYFWTVTPRFWSSTQPPMPGWPNGSTFSHVGSFGRLAPLLDTPVGSQNPLTTPQVAPSSLAI